MMNTVETPTCTKPMLGDVLSALAKKELQVKLLIGYRDCVNGYGWHVRYYVEVFKTVEYCPKCRAKYNVNYKDDQYPLHHQHSHHTQVVNVYAKEFMSEDDLCVGLLNIA